MAKYQFPDPTILLVEHGDTDFSGSGDEDRIHGTKYDLPLTDKGRKQAKHAAGKLVGYDIASLHHSPMLRAKQTAAAISDAVGVQAVPVEGLLPWDSGFVSGMKHGQAKDIVAYYVRNPHKAIRDGEPYGDWWDAFQGYMAGRLKEAKKAKTGGKYQALVEGVHSSEVTSAPAIIKGDPAQVLNQRLPSSGEIAALIFRGGKWKFQPDWKG